jgi:zinc protease
MMAANEIAGLPDAAPPRPVEVPPLQQTELGNGLGVVVARRRNAPLVTAMLLLRQGAEADPAGRAGLASMTATVLTKGARRGGRPLGATELARQAEALGATLDSGSGWRSSTLGMTVTTPKLGAALALLADVARFPTLAADELERARSQALDGLRVTLADPGAVSSMALRRAFWGGSAYGASSVPASLQRLTRADLQGFHARAWRPDQAVLVLAGDIAPDEALALARRHFGAWRAGANSAVPEGAAAPASITPALVLLDMPGSGQAGVGVAAPYIAIGAADRRTAQVAAAVLGGGYSARLNQEVRIKRGLSYGASGGGEAQPSGGMFSAQAQTNHPTAVQVLQLLRGEITRLADSPPSADELAARQATLVGGFARRLETTGGLASLLATQIAQGLPLEALRRTVDELMAVTPAQVAAFARQHWRADALRSVMALDVAAAGESLKALDEPALRLTMAELDLERPGLTKP